MKNLRCEFRSEVMGLKSFVYKGDGGHEAMRRSQAEKSKKNETPDQMQQVGETFANAWRSVSEVNPERQKINERIAKAKKFFTLAQESGVSTAETDAVQTKVVGFENDIVLRDYLVEMAKTLDHNADGWRNFYEALQNAGMLGIINDRAVVAEYNRKSTENAKGNQESYAAERARYAEEDAIAEARRNAPPLSLGADIDGAVEGLKKMMTVSDSARENNAKIAERVRIAKNLYDTAEAQNVSTTDTYKLILDLSKNDDGSIKNPSRVESEYEFNRYMIELAKTLNRDSENWGSFYVQLDQEVKDIVNSHEVLVADNVERMKRAPLKKNAEQVAPRQDTSAEALGEAHDIEQIENGLGALLKMIERQNPDMVEKGAKIAFLREMEKIKNADANNAIALTDHVIETLTTNPNFTLDAATQELLGEVSGDLQNASTRHDLTEAVSKFVSVNTERPNGVAEVRATEAPTGGTTKVRRSRPKDGSARAEAQSSSSERETPVAALRATRENVTESKRNPVETKEVKWEKAVEATANWLSDLVNSNNEADRGNAQRIYNNINTLAHDPMDTQTEFLGRTTLSGTNERVFKAIQEFQRNINNELPKEKHIRIDGTFKDISYTAFKATNMAKEPILQPTVKAAEKPKAEQSILETIKAEDLGLANGKHEGKPGDIFKASVNVSRTVNGEKVWIHKDTPVVVTEAIPDPKDPKRMIKYKVRSANGVIGNMGVDQLSLALNSDRAKFVADLQAAYKAKKEGEEQAKKQAEVQLDSFLADALTNPGIDDGNAVVAKVK